MGFFRKHFSRAVKGLKMNAPLAAGASVEQGTFSAAPRFPLE
jgi:hypothetical protein